MSTNGTKSEDEQLECFKFVGIITLSYYLKGQLSFLCMCVCCCEQQIANILQTYFLDIPSNSKPEDSSAIRLQRSAGAQCHHSIFYPHEYSVDFWWLAWVRPYTKFGPLGARVLRIILDKKLVEDKQVSTRSRVFFTPLFIKWLWPSFFWRNVLAEVTRMIQMQTRNSIGCYRNPRVFFHFNGPPRVELGCFF